MITEIHQISTDTQRQSDIEFATRAVIYLEKKGLRTEEVVECLIDEFDLDRETARRLASLAA
jgi:hypothetical protein